MGFAFLHFRPGQCESEPEREGTRGGCEIVVDAWDIYTLKDKFQCEDTHEYG